MNRSTKLGLKLYLFQLERMPETRQNISLIDSVLYLLQEKPDTEESLDASRNTVAE